MAKWLELWGLSLFPPTVASVKALAASLKAGGYKSANVYLTVYRRECERRGHVIGALLRSDFQDYKRSCGRGLGGPVRPRALPLDALHHLPALRDPWSPDGPLNPRAAMLCGAWWLCREIELSTARARMVELQWASSPPAATWHLPTSKSDTRPWGWQGI